MAGAVRKGTVRRRVGQWFVAGALAALAFPAVDPALAQGGAQQAADEFIDYTDPEVQRRTGLRPVPMGPTCRPPRGPGGPDVRAARIRACLYTAGSQEPPRPAGWFWREQSFDIYNCPPGSEPKRYRVLTGERHTKDPCGKTAWDMTREYADTFGETWPRNVPAADPPERPEETRETIKLEIASRAPALGSPVSDCSYAGQPGCHSPLRIASRIATDSQAYCTYGTAEPEPALFTPADEFGNPFTGPFNIGDTTRPRSRTPSAMDDPGNPHVQTGDDRRNVLNATHGPDDIAGGKERDTFRFHIDTRSPDLASNTLDDGDRIRDYESGEVITVTGVRLTRQNVKVSYDPEKDETRIEFDIPDPNTGRLDGQPDRTLLLNGDKRGQVTVESNCCSDETTEIWIKIPEEKGAPRTTHVPDGQGQQEQKPAEQERAEPRQQQQGQTPSSGAQQSDTSRQSQQKQAEGTPAGEQQAPEPPSAPPQQSGQIVPQEPVTVFIKATETVLQGDATGTGLKEQSVKLVALDEPALPEPGKTKPVQDVGHDRDPVTCTTGADGQCRAEIPPEERKIYGFPAQGPRFYRTDLSLRRKTGAVIEGNGAQLAALPAVPGVMLVKSDFKIGDKTYTRLDIRAPDAVAAGVMEKLRAALGPRVEVDPCEEKKPGPPLGMEPASAAAHGRALPEATVRLGRGAVP